MRGAFFRFFSKSFILKIDRTCRKNRFDKYYGFLIIKQYGKKSNTFTFWSKYDTIHKVF